MDMVGHNAEGMKSVHFAISIMQAFGHQVGDTMIGQPAWSLPRSIQCLIPLSEKTTFFQVSPPGSLGWVSNLLYLLIYPLPLGHQFLNNDSGEGTGQVEGDEEGGPRRLDVW